MKDKLRSNYTGKQFVTIRSKEGKTPDTYFEKKHNWISEVSTTRCCLVDFVVWLSRVINSLTGQSTLKLRRKSRRDF